MQLRRYDAILGTEEVYRLVALTSFYNKVRAPGGAGARPLLTRPPRST